MNKHYCECIHINGTLRWTKEGDASDAEITVRIENDKINKYIHKKLIKMLYAGTLSEKVKIQIILNI